MLQSKPNQRYLITLPSGKLAEGCCCVRCDGTCCCDKELDPWFQPTLTITITEVVEADTEETTASLQCLIGDWVLPFKQVVGNRCQWTNTFCASETPGAGVFRITAEVEHKLSEELAVSPISCVNLLIEVLSCRDCHGNVMLAKPDIVFENKTADCDTSYPADPTIPPSCGCNELTENQLIDGDWDALTDAELPIGDLTSTKIQSYSGECWKRPEVRDDGGTLYLENARLVTGAGADVTGSYTASLGCLETTVPFIRDAFNEASVPCKYFQETTSASFPTTMDPVPRGANPAVCGYSTEVAAPYTTCFSVSGFSVTYYYSAVNYTIFPGCVGDADPTYIRLGEFTDSGTTVFIEVEARFEPAGYGRGCEVKVTPTIPAVPCPTDPNPQFCNNFIGACSGDPVGDPTALLYELAFPTDAVQPAEVNYCGTGSLPDYPPDYVEDAPIVTNPDGYDWETNTANTACETTCVPERLCGLEQVITTIPTIVAADDYAPAGARYEVLYTLVDLEGTSVQYSAVYTKTLGGGNPAYPKGYWQLDWTMPLNVFGTNQWCSCTQVCQEHINTIRARLTVNVEGRVPGTTLWYEGVKGTATDPVDLCMKHEVQLFGSTDGAIDPCCDCLEPTGCTALSCNNCTCDTNTNTEDPSVHHDVLTQKPRSTYCCDCFYATAYNDTYSATGSYSVPGVCCGRVFIVGYVTCDKDSTTATATETTVNTYGGTCGGDPVLIRVERTRVDEWHCSPDTPENPGAGRCSYSLVITYPDAEADPCCATNSVFTIDQLLPPCPQYDCTSQIWLINGDVPLNYQKTCGDPFPTTTPVILRTCGGTLTITDDVDCELEPCDAGFEDRHDSQNYTLARVNTPSVPCTNRGIGSPVLEPDGGNAGHEGDNCSTVSVTGNWRFRMHFATEAECDAYKAALTMDEFGHWFTAQVFLFDGMGGVYCEKVYSTEPTCYTDLDGGAYLYTWFYFSKQVTHCGLATNPAILLGDICPFTPGDLVEISLDGERWTSYSADCADPDCQL